MHSPTSDWTSMSAKLVGMWLTGNFCGALKLTLFYPDRNVLEVFYAGTHTCSLKSRSAYNLMPQKMKKAVLKPHSSEKSTGNNKTDFQKRQQRTSCA